ncbi:MAG: hypothetical protein WAV27_11385 [Xanthobacteraceae bacterium]
MLRELEFVVMAMMEQELRRSAEAEPALMRQERAQKVSGWQELAQQELAQQDLARQAPVRGPSAQAIR